MTTKTRNPTQRIRGFGGLQCKWVDPQGRKCRKRANPKTGVCGIHQQEHQHREEINKVLADTTAVAEDHLRKMRLRYVAAGVAASIVSFFAGVAL